MSLRGVLFWKKWVGALYSFREDNEESLVEIATPLPFKAMDAFLRTWKKMGHIVDLEATNKVH